MMRERLKLRPVDKEAMRIAEVLWLQRRYKDHYEFNKALLKNDLDGEDEFNQEVIMIRYANLAGVVSEKDSNVEEL